MEHIEPDVPSGEESGLQSLLGSIQSAAHEVPLLLLNGRPMSFVDETRPTEPHAPPGAKSSSQTHLKPAKSACLEVPQILVNSKATSFADQNPLSFMSISIPSFMSAITLSPPIVTLHPEPEKPVSRFEQLPGELRNQIYRYLLSSEYAKIVKKDTTQQTTWETRNLGIKSYRFSTAIFRVNRDISCESQAFFYDTNRFVKVLTNSVYTLMFATRNLPVVYPEDSTRMCRHVLDAVIHVCAPTVTEVTNHYQVCLVARDIPTLIDYLRVAEIAAYLDYREVGRYLMKVSLDIKANQESGIERERSILRPFKELVRVTQCEIKGGKDCDTAQDVVESMLRWPPIGPDVIRHCEKIRRNSRKARKDIDLDRVHRQYAISMDFFTRTLRRHESGLVEEPETVITLVGLRVEYTMELSLLLVRHESFAWAVKYAQDGVDYIRQTMPDCDPAYRAQAYLQLCLVQTQVVYPYRYSGSAFPPLPNEPLMRDNIAFNRRTARSLLPSHSDFQELLDRVYYQVYGRVRREVAQSV